MNATSGAQRGRPPGQPKTGGREKGTPNRDTTALREKLAALGCDPTSELVKIARDPETETGTKVNIYSLLMRHTTPVPKPEDFSQEHGTDESASCSIDEVVKLAKYVIEQYGPKAVQQSPTKESPGETTSSDKEAADEK